MTLEEFKANAGTIKQVLSESRDTIDIEHGVMIIHEDNLMKYLEKYLCKDEDELSDTLYYRYGVYVRILRDEENECKH